MFKLLKKAAMGICNLMLDVIFFLLKERGLKK